MASLGTFCLVGRVGQMRVVVDDRDGVNLRAAFTANAVCFFKILLLTVVRFKSKVNCNSPFFVLLPNCNIGAVSFGGCASNVAISEVACQMKSSIVVSGIGMVCGMNVRVSTSILVRV